VLEFVRGNLALRDHSENGEEVHLFEQLAGAVVVEHAVRVPEIVVAVLPTLLAGHDDHDGRLDGGK
jgi:hypothetical protein